MRRSPAILVLGLLATGLTACSNDASRDDGITTVAVAFYPIEEIVRQVGGDTVDVVTLVPPGEEAHEYDPTPKQLTELADADIVFYLGQGFQPNVEKALESLPPEVQKVDLLAQGGIALLPVTSQLPGTDGTAGGETLDGGDDPHVWLAPQNMNDMAANVLASLNVVAPDDATTFVKNYGNYGTELNNLDRDFASGLARCRSPFIVSSHRAFAYLADAYGLQAVAIAGVSPSEEPSAKTLEAVAEFARTNDVTTIFFEENLPADLAKTLADEVGASTGVLDTIESLSADQLAAGDDYVSLMRTNLAALPRWAGLLVSTAVTPILEVRDLGVHYGERHALHDVSFAVGRGELIAVIGPNGAGKSTMFKAICGLVNHDGVVEVNGVHCHDHTDRMDLAYIPQRNDSDLHFPITVGELVVAGRRRFRRWYQRPTDTDRAAAEAALERVQLGGAGDRALTELSGGQLQRAYVARALAQEASVVLLDEALSGVDQPSTLELLDVFESLAAQGTTLLVATHDLALARRRFTRCLAVNGTLRADGAPATVLTTEALDSTFGSTDGTRGFRALAD